MKILICPLLCCLLLPAGAQNPPAPEPTPAPEAAAPEKPKINWSPAAKAVLEASDKNDLPAAFKLAQTGAEAGDLECRFFLGRMFEKGLGTTADPVKAAEYYQKAAADSHPEAMTNFARCLELGIGLKPEPAKADFFYQQAAEAGFFAAQSRMGELEMDGIRRPVNEKAAFDWFQKAAAQNDGTALYRLSVIHQNGFAGQEKNAAKAVESALKGANTGNMDAANQVGLYYQYGYGLRQDKIAAAGWFNFAAQHDHPSGLTNLGQCYEVGQGVKLNHQTAARIYADAAKKNDAAGCLCLARCFRDGRGLTADPVKAAVNFRRASALGLKPAQPLLEELEKKLTPAQKTEAAKLYKEVTGTAW